MNYQKIIIEALPVIRETGRFLRREITKVGQQDIETKQAHDYVTYVDKTSEQQLVKGLKKILPNAGFLTEEKTILQDRDDLFWIIDPLDGTTNYIHQLPPYSISVALVSENNLVGGIVYEVSHDELFYAWKNGGAFLNGKPIRTSATSNFSESFYATGFPFRDYSYINPYMDLLKYFMEHTQGLRRLGSAAVDLVYTACGRFDGFFEYSLAPWDVAGGAIILQEAGGIVSDFSGNNNFLYGEEIIAGNPHLHSQILEIIKRYIQH